MASPKNRGGEGWSKGDSCKHLWGVKAEWFFDIYRKNDAHNGNGVGFILRHEIYLHSPSEARQGSLLRLSHPMTLTRVWYSTVYYTSNSSQSSFSVFSWTWTCSAQCVCPPRLKKSFTTKQRAPEFQLTSYRSPFPRRCLFFPYDQDLDEQYPGDHYRNHSWTKWNAREIYQIFECQFWFQFSRKGLTHQADTDVDIGESWPYPSLAT